eukprot:s657_g8.t1
MVHSAEKRGLVVNFDQGKSEVMLNLVGPGTRSVKESIAANGSELVIEIDQKQCRLRSVLAYRHLGTWLQHSGKQQRDARFRLSQAKQAWGPLVKPFFSKPQISIVTKVQVLSSLVMSRYCYNVHTWSMPEDGVLTEWSNALRPLLCPLARKFLLGLPPFQFGVDILCGVLQLLSPADQLHANRLRYFRRFLQTCTQSLWNLLFSVQADQRSWISRCLESFSWLAKFYGPKLGLTASSSCQDWVAFVRLDNAWKGKLRRAVKACIQYRLAEAEATVWQSWIHQELDSLDLIKSHSYPSSSEIFDPPELADGSDSREDVDDAEPARNPALADLADAEGAEDHGEPKRDQGELRAIADVELGTSDLLDVPSETPALEDRPEEPGALVLAIPESPEPAAEDASTGLELARREDGADADPVRSQSPEQSPTSREAHMRAAAVTKPAAEVNPILKSLQPKNKQDMWSKIHGGRQPRAVPSLLAVHGSQGQSAAPKLPEGTTQLIKEPQVTNVVVAFGRRSVTVRFP